LIGVEQETGGAPAGGSNLRLKSADETVIDGNLARSSDINLGDNITIKSIQGTEEEFYSLKVVGITDGRQYFFQPSIFVSLEVWEKIRPQAAPGLENSPIAYNILAARLQPGADAGEVAGAIESQVEDIEVSDIETAYKATPGYAAQQSTLNTQRGFTLLIGILVIGGFFQIQTLQKIPNIGMLKAIGTGNLTVGMAVVMQILMVTVFGVVLGTLATLGLAALMPAGTLYLFTPDHPGNAVTGT
jgi:putative ABC transport system permease protein